MYPLYTGLGSNYIELFMKWKNLNLFFIENDLLYTGALSGRFDYLKKKMSKYVTY